MTVGLQVNFKGGEPPLVNLYVPDGDPVDYRDDMEGKLDVLAELALKIAETGALIAAACTAAGLLGGRSMGSGAAASPAPPQTGTGPACDHGPRVHKEGVSQKTGKPWKAWDCPLGICPRQFRNG